MLAVVTGEIGIGKTTVCRRVLPLMLRRGYTCGGVITYKDGDGGIVVQDVGNGQETILATRDEGGSGLRMGQYLFNDDGLAFGIHALETGCRAALFVVDEIGPLELMGQGFHRALALIRGRGDGNTLVVVRQGLVAIVLPALGAAPRVFVTSRANRDILPGDICLSLVRPRATSRLTP